MPDELGDVERRAIGVERIEILLDGAPVEVEGARTSEKSYTDALRERDRLIASFSDWAAPFDAILTPPATGEAPAPDTTGDARFCSRWSLLGAPAITIPTGLGPDRLPLGLQLVASPFDDARLLAAAAWAESVLPSPGAPPL